METRPEPTAWRLGYRPGLDGLRGVAVILVVLAHEALVRNAGAVGVNVFFVLSGFLITSLLLVEARDAGRIDLVAFYRRRAARLLPALFAVSFVVGTYLVLTDQPERLLPDVGGALSYVGNWLQIAGVKMVLTSHTWSLAVEEQFYLVWPLLMIVLVRVSRAGWIVGALLVASLLWRIALVDVFDASGARSSRGLDSAAAALLAGCALAYLVRARPTLTTGRIGFLLGAGLIGLVVAMLALRLGSAWNLELTALGTVLIISSVQATDGGVLAFPPLVYIGRISYGIYLWHFPIIAVMKAPVVVEIAVTLGVSMLSFHLLEAPFLRRFGRRADKPVSAAAPDGRPFRTEPTISPAPQGAGDATR
jgi:peptidoglycan/LPS O-acetylase OafA/YrhL